MTHPPNDSTTPALAALAPVAPELLAASSPTPAPPAPPILEGRFGWRSVCFNPGRLPIVKLTLRRRRVQGCALVVLALIIVGFFYLARRDFARALKFGREELWIMLVIGFLVSEALFWLWPVVAAAGAVARFRRGGRLGELALTRLLPVEIGQIMLGRFIQSGRLFIFTIAGAMGFSILALNRIEALPLLALLVVNAWIMLHGTAWIRLTLCLGFQNGLRSLVETLLATLAMLLAQLPVILVYIQGIVVCHEFAQLNNTTANLLIYLTLFPFALILLGIKYAFGRAYALHLHRAVFPGLTY